MEINVHGRWCSHRYDLCIVSCRMMPSDLNSVEVPRSDLMQIGLVASEFAIFVDIAMVSESCHSGFNIRMVQRHIYCTYSITWVCLKTRYTHTYIYIHKYIYINYIYIYIYTPQKTLATHQFCCETGHISGLHIPVSNAPDWIYLGSSIPLYPRHSPSICISTLNPSFNDIHTYACTYTIYM